MHDDDDRLMQQQSKRCTYLVTEVDPSDKLLEQPQSSCLWQSCRVVHGLMPVYVVSQVAPCCVFRHYGQVLRREEDFPELDDMGVVEAQALVEHLPGCYFHTAPCTRWACKALPLHTASCACKVTPFCQVARLAQPHSLSLQSLPLTHNSQLQSWPQL